MPYSSTGSATTTGRTGRTGSTRSFTSNPNTDNYVVASFLNENADNYRLQVARFLSKTTFGPTTSDLNNWIVPPTGGGNRNPVVKTFVDWVTDQINRGGVTPHREYYRQRLAPRSIDTAPPVREHARLRPIGGNLPSRSRIGNYRVEYRRISCSRSRP